MLRRTTLFSFLVLFLLCTIPIQSAEFRDRGILDNSESEIIVPEKPTYAGKGGQTYEGNLRVHVVEIASRFNTSIPSRNFEYGFLDYAANEILSIPYQDTYTLNTTWDGNIVGFGDITENNIIVIAAVYNAEPHAASSGGGYPFTAYYCDASAAATPGNPGANLVDEEYTHTVYVEYGVTAT
jgi:hypothetical protein